MRGRPGWWLVIGLWVLGCDDGGGSAAPPGDDAAPPPGDDAAVVPGTDAGPQSDAGPEADGGGGPRGRLVINEIIAAGGEDGIELTVVGAAPVELAGYTLVDDKEGREPAALPAGSLAPGAFLYIVARSDDPGDGSPWVPFKLGGADAVTLAHAGTIAARVAWEDGEAPAGTSLGRLPDGMGPFVTCTPTPGAPNQAGSGPPTVFDPDRVVEVRVAMDPADWATLLADPLSKTWLPGQLTFDGEAIGEVGIRTKGNSSLNSVDRMGGERFSFKVDVDRFVDGQRVRGVRTLNLNNGFKDPTLMRERLASRLAAALNLPAPRTAFVDLWVADLHMGLYTLVEQVDADFLEDHFGDGDGDLYKPEPPTGTLQWRGDSIASYAGLEPESNEDTTDHAAFLALVAALDAGDPGAYNRVMDVDEVLAYLALQAALVSLDSYPGSGHNYYLYEIDGTFRVIPWDMNEAFGVFTCGCDRAQLVDLAIDEPICGRLADRPLVARLLAEPVLKTRYRQHLQTLIDGPLVPATFEAMVVETADLIRPFVQADDRKFFTDAQFERGLREDVPNGMSPSPGLIGFMGTGSSASGSSSRAGGRRAARRLARAVAA
ncbi:MAG: CotH kinase family protein [bacterium]